MDLIQFFRLILMVLFQRTVCSVSTNAFQKFNYDTVYFYVPKIFCKDGFSISFQIHNGAYCSSENGYRELGHTMKEVEFGFPSEEEELLRKYAEDPEELTSTVGRIPIEVAQQVIDKHGGIDWNETVSIETFNNFVKLKNENR